MTARPAMRHGALTFDKTQRAWDAVAAWLEPAYPGLNHVSRTLSLTQHSSSSHICIDVAGVHEIILFAQKMQCG